MNKPFSFIAATFLCIVSFAHVVRLIFRVPISVSHNQVPLWVSIIPIIVLPIFAIMLRKEART